MLIFDQYIDKEINLISILYLKLKFKQNKQFRLKFEQYKIMSSNLKQMFIINEAEKELKKVQDSKNSNTLFEKYLSNNNRDKDILNYLDSSFSN